ncbi:hypothetical protein [Leptolyngbya sp. 7M]|uniref:hypothetical protein n=1 Tax=Leptolyngbya sp. 7M TaxID=2812896 RepID=UPI001B8BFC9F|nr:hypothetical protein [Leptolyngbya sp. 7M]QYO66757.1 hypothetical protein JVX88_08110 [Leptolyngbya sp. 7M]
MEIYSAPKGWLGFEQNVLARLEFKSVAIPFTSDPAIAVALKRRGARVSTNDMLQSAYTRSVAYVQNGSEVLSEEDVNEILNDVYVPGHKLRNPALKNWFAEIDCWWFDNIRTNLDRLGSPFKFALGADLVFQVGEYVRSFDEETRELRQPLSSVFRRLWLAMPSPVNNGQNNSCHNVNTDDFIAEATGDLMFLRLPVSGIGGGGFTPDAVWREEWLRGGNSFWADLNAQRAGKLGSQVETKSQYLNMLAETLTRAGHLKTWAIAHVENTFVSTQELVESIGKLRKVEAIYSKDFSELTGTKAVMITA